MTDRDEERVDWIIDGLAAIRTAEPPAELYAAVGTEIRSRPRRAAERRASRWSLAFAAILVLLALVAGTIAMQGGSGPLPSPTSRPTTTPTALPTASARPSGPLPPPDTGTLGRLWTHDGEPVPFSVLGLQPGPGHCGWDDLLILTMNQVLGQPSVSSDTDYQYVRDPRNRWADEPTDGSDRKTLGRFEPSVPKPADAVFTGYVYADGMELWRSEAATDAVIFLHRGDTWEQWPRTRAPIGCT